jgi:hypothetical protein
MILIFTCISTDSGKLLSSHCRKIRKLKQKYPGRTQIWILNCDLRIQYITFVSECVPLLVRTLFISYGDF